MSLPLYYKETFFSKDTLLHPEVSSVYFGVAGDPVPYVVRNDNLITGLLLMCFVLTLFVFSHFRRYLAKQYRALLLPPRDDVALRETPGELRMKILLTLQTCLLFSIVAYFMMKEYYPGTYVIDSDYLFIILFFAMLVVYALLKSVLYTIVNNVFFDGKRNGLLLRSLLLASATQGVLLLPVVLLLVYFELSLQNVFYFFLLVVVLGKLYAFYKSFVIFFRQNGGFMQNILYLCALEIIPLAVLVGTWAVVVDLLKVNY